VNTTPQVFVCSGSQVHRSKSPIDPANWARRVGFQL
jgi:hypothetical protein